MSFYNMITTRARKYGKNIDKYGKNIDKNKEWQYILWPPQGASVLNANFDFNHTYSHRLYNFYQKVSNFMYSIEPDNCTNTSL